MSKVWKELERVVARKLGGKRIVRGDNFAVSNFDVSVPDMPHWRIDAKYRAKQAHHKHLRAVREKYCTDKAHVAILVTKAKGEHGEVVSMGLDDFANLLLALRGLKQAWAEITEPA